MATCKQCEGIVPETRRKDSKFCSDYCRKKHWDMNHRGRGKNAPEAKEGVVE